MNKVIIIGCGNVGMSYAFSLLNQNTNVNELVLIDINKEKIIGEAMDLNHCLAFSPSKIDIRVGDYSDCKDAKLIVSVFSLKYIYESSSNFRTILQNTTLVIRTEK